MGRCFVCPDQNSLYIHQSKPSVLLFEMADEIPNGTAPANPDVEMREEATEVNAMIVIHPKHSTLTPGRRLLRVP